MKDQEPRRTQVLGKFTELHTYTWTSGHRGKMLPIISDTENEGLCYLKPNDT